MSWTAVVPLKGGDERKSRLAGRLSTAERAALAERLAARVIAALEACPAVGRIILLSPARLDDPRWHADEGRGLNRELQALRDASLGQPFMVIHGDLPLVEPADVSALLAAATPIAIAPDRHGQGTNALALGPGRSLPFAFGPGSFALHRAAAPDAAIVTRDGLAIDLDEPADLDLLSGLGLAP